MPPRSLSESSPVGVMQWTDEEGPSSIDTIKKPMNTVSTGKSSITRKSALRKSALTKSVRFAKSDEVFPVEHLDDMPAHEVASIWYDPKEYAEIKESYQVTVFMMENNNDFQENDEHTIRGLEYRTQTGAWARYENKRDAYNAVLDEQDRQWKVDIDDFEIIRTVYLQHSSKCSLAAHERAVEDARVAKEICSIFYKKKKSSSINSTTETNKEVRRKASIGDKESRHKDVRDELDQIKKEMTKDKKRVTIE